MKGKFQKFNVRDFLPIPYMPKTSGYDIKKMALGGILNNVLSGASTGSMFGPLGTALGTGIGLTSGIVNQIKDDKAKNEVTIPNSGQTNAFGNLQFALGGKTYKYENGGFTEFTGPTHEQGGIPYKGVEVENNEVEVKIKDGSYVLSDRLINPLTNNSLAKDAKGIDKKYKDRSDSISKRSRELENEKLVNINEILKNVTQVEQNQRKLAYGDFTDPNDLNGNRVYPVFAPRPNADLNANVSGINNIPTANVPNQPNMLGEINQFVDELTPKPKANLFGNLTSGDKMQLYGSAIPAVANLARGVLGRAETVDPNYNQYNDQIIRDANNMRVDYQSLINQDNLATNALREAINAGTTSSGVRNSNLQAAYANSAARRADISLKEQMANNQLTQYRNQTKRAIGLDNVQAEERARMETAANKSAKQNLISEGLSNSAEGLTRAGQGVNAGLFNMRTYGQLMEMFPDFTLNDWQDFINSGKTLKEYVKFRKR